MAYIDIESVRTLNYFRHLSNLNIIVNYNSKIYIDLEKKIFCNKPISDNSRIFIEIVYEKLPEIALDFENNVFRMDVAVYVPSKDMVLIVKKGSKISILEAQGKMIIPLINSGESVENDAKIFYKITKKNETRTSRAETTGLVVYIGEVFMNELERMLAVIVGEKDVIKLSRCYY